MKHFILMLWLYGAQVLKALVARERQYVAKMHEAEALGAMELMA